jgi:hypothetical protein
MFIDNINAFLKGKKVLVLDDETYRLKIFLDNIDNCLAISKASSFYDIFYLNKFDVIFLDCNLEWGPDGNDIVNFIVKWNHLTAAPNHKTTYIIHSNDPTGAKEMYDKLRNNNIPCLLMPFYSLSKDWKIPCQRKNY